MTEHTLRDAKVVQEAINAYYNKYAIDPPFRLSTPYHLANEWKSRTIPNADRCGCYFFYDEGGGLLYIGKVSLKHTLGRRTTSYFQKDAKPGRPIPIHDGWTSPPAWLQTARVNEPYEAPSLEEYLIDRLNPPDNTRGWKPKS